jgi:hypothetical protein
MKLNVKMLEVKTVMEEEEEKKRLWEMKVVIVEEEHHHHYDSIAMTLTSFWSLEGCFFWFVTTVFLHSLNMMGNLMILFRITIVTETI